MVSGLQLRKHFQLRAHQAELVIARYTALREQLEEIRGVVQQELEAAAFDLSVAYLPTLAAADLQRAESLTGFRGFTRRDPNKAMAHERMVLQRTIARIEADERYQNRELLVGPRGERVVALDEAKAMLEPWNKECLEFEILDGFLELVEIGYDTPRFTESWLHLSYWKHWAQGDAICAALKMDDFGDDVLPAWTKADGQRQFWRAEVEKLDAAVQEVHDLVQQHDQSLARLPALPALYLEQAQRLLSEHLKVADIPLLDEWLTRDPGEHRPVRMALRRVSGLKAKLRYLEELDRQGLAPLLTNIGQRQRKYRRKAVKYSRRKHMHNGHSTQAMDHKFEAKHQKLLGRGDKLEKALSRLARYDDYGRFDLGNEDDLWWREFTGSRPPRMMPSTRQWYDANPDHRVAHDDWSDGVGEAVAQAFVASEAEEVYLS